LVSLAELSTLMVRPSALKMVSPSAVLIAPPVCSVTV
jgi:hypothetical protein